MKNLSLRHQHFVAALLAQRDYNATRAYEIVYNIYGEVASSAAAHLMARPEVKAAIEAGKAERLKRLELTADDVLRDIALGVGSDGGELSEFVIDACRYCYGDGHKYQRTPREYREAWNAYRSSKEGKGDPLGLNFDPQGGVGFDPRKGPHTDCPECFGRGEGRTIIKDTRFLSEAGRRQYSGVKMTKHGPELIGRSRDKALEIAAKHTGVARENINVRTVRDLTDEELAQKTAQIEHELRKGAK